MLLSFQNNSEMCFRLKVVEFERRLANISLDEADRHDTGQWYKKGHWHIFSRAVVRGLFFCFFSGYTWEVENSVFFIFKELLVYAYIGQIKKNNVRGSKWNPPTSVMNCPYSFDLRLGQKPLRFFFVDLMTQKEHFEINWPLLPEHNGVKGFIKSHFFFIFSKLMVNCDSVKTLIPLWKMQSLLMPRHQSRAVGTVGQDNPFSHPSILAERSKPFPKNGYGLYPPKIFSDLPTAL